MKFLRKYFFTVISFVILTTCLIVLPNNPALAAIHPDDTEAAALKELGIFNGRGDGFALSEQPTRVEAAIILLRLIGKESVAEAANLANNFDDVPDWADAQIGYLYQEGFVKGTSDTHFGNDAVNFEQMMTMILRAMGYREDAGDFTWNSAAEDAVTLFVITPRCYDEISLAGDFTRKELVSCIFYALQAPLKNGDNLIKFLADNSVFSHEQITNTGISDLLIASDLVRDNFKNYRLHQKFTILPTNTSAADPASATSSLILTVNLPDNYFNRQRVIEHTFSIEPSYYLFDEGMLYAVFILTDIKQTIVLNIVTDLKIDSYDLNAAEKLHFPIRLSEDEREKYTAATSWIESDAPEFTNAQLKSTDGSQIQLLKEIMNYTLKKMTPKITDDESTALTALQQGYGDCWEYSAIFTALCRAHGIPARIIISDWPDNEASGHAIVEVFVDDLGWVPFDPVNIDTHYTTFNEIDTDLIYLTCNDHSDILSGGDYYVGYGYNCKLEIKEYVSKE